ncbi:MAG: hypothetical protein ABR540_11540 [Acidimicrobiales bacterium]|nr:hypothetical protein [Actinomycetota bacterium]
MTGTLRHRAGRIRLSMLLLVVVTLLAGCGGDGGDGTLIRVAPDKTIDAGTSRLALNVNFTTGAEARTVHGEGVVDLKNRLGAVTVDLGSLGGSLGTGTVDTVLDPSGLYVKLPPGLLPGGRPWYKLELATLSPQAGLSLGSLGQLAQTDPTQALGYLRGATDDVSEVGEESVRGVSTTHYRAPIDLRKASASLPPDGKKAVEDLIASSGSATLPADVWLDAEGRLRRMKFSLDPDGAGPTSAGTVELELFEFGVAADVQIPPADQVTDLTQLFQGGTPPSLPS